MEMLPAAKIDVVVVNGSIVIDMGKNPKPVLPKGQNQIMVDLFQPVVYNQIGDGTEPSGTRFKYGGIDPMIRRRQEMNTEPRFEVKGGRGGYDSTHILTAADCDKISLFAVNTLPPGSSIGIHTHTTEAEAYLILQGQATVTEDGQDFILRPGDVEYCSDGHSHGIANDSDEPLAFLAIILK